MQTTAEVFREGLLAKWTHGLDSEGAEFVEVSDALVFPPFVLFTGLCSGAA
jgi:hypothetical protein